MVNTRNSDYPLFIENEIEDKPKPKEKPSVERKRENEKKKKLKIKNMKKIINSYIII